MNELIALKQLSEESNGRLTPSQKGGKIHTRSFKGKFRSLRIGMAGILATVFFGASWLNWNGHQAVLWDLSQRKFYIFGATFFPEDFILLTFILIVSALLLFAVTAIAGRIWCGYACPQSSWTWAFMWIEKVTEGDSFRRARLDTESWSSNKIIRRGTKHLLWGLASIATAIAFVGYFMPVRELVSDLVRFQLDVNYAFWIVTISTLTYLNAGWLREKVCAHACPYARFQIVMFDKDTTIIGYDAKRGEGRGSRRKGEDYRSQGLGDCIDCRMCVQVCPTGIDIRNGLQLDCIACAACVDACDSVMEKMGYEPGLVGYTSERKLAADANNPKDGEPLFKRARFIGYIAVFGVVMSILALNLQGRDQVGLSVHRDRNVVRVNTLGEEVNVYVLKITNKTQLAQTYKMMLESDKPLYLTRDYQVNVAPGERLDLPVAVAFKNQGLAAQEDSAIKFDFNIVNTLRPNDMATQTATFLFNKKKPEFLPKTKL